MINYYIVGTRDTAISKNNLVLGFMTWEAPVYRSGGGKTSNNHKNKCKIKKFLKYYEREVHDTLIVFKQGNLTKSGKSGGQALLKKVTGKLRSAAYSGDK